MFRVNVGDDIWTVDFSHGTDDSGSRFTLCQLGVSRSEDEMPLNSSSGISLCSRKDNFNKATGRKLALTRALAYHDRGFRTKIWEAYFHRIRSQKSNAPRDLSLVC